MSVDKKIMERIRNLLALAAGTGRDSEQARLDIILTWMWEVVLPEVSAHAENSGIKKEWEDMLLLKTSKAASCAAGAGAAAAADYATSWQNINPTKLLEQLIEVQ